MTTTQPRSSYCTAQASPLASRGTAAAGPEEVLELASYGLSPRDALGAASWRARSWLGLDDNLAEGTTADLVVYDESPLEDLRVLGRPARVVLRGNVVA